MNLLLAEDDAVTAAFITEVLAAAGHRIEVVGDAAGALARLRSTRYDLLLLDLNLPGMRADALLATLRQGAPPAASADAPAIALSADLRPDTGRALLAAGFAQVAEKPISATALRALVGSLQVSSNPPQVAGLDPSPWDDAAALAMCSGRQASVDALRALFIAELPAQRRRLQQAFDAGEPAVAQAELHRLRAACGFCGAHQLRDLANRIDAGLARGEPPSAALIAAWERGCDALLSPDRTSVTPS